MKPGDKVISDLDGLEYEVVKWGARNDLEPLADINLVGACAIVKDKDGKEHVLYEWEITELEYPKD